MKRTLCVLLSILAVLLPFLGTVGVVLSMPTVYHNSFTASLVDKYERLSSIEGEKLVIVGGSSVAFGYESALLEKYLDMPVVNFGVYAALGTKVMMDLSLGELGEGDIVILAPELSEQTLSLYFNGEMMLTSCEEDPSLLLRLRADDLLSSLGALYNFAGEKYRRLSTVGVPDPEGVYRRDSFNERGDISYIREKNVMPTAYDPTTKIDLCESIVSQDFIEYVNDYVKKAQKRGATVYFGYCPMNEAALENTEQEELAFGEYLTEVLDCPVLGDVRDFTSDAGYFYDTNFHLNSDGARKHTLDILRALAMELSLPLTVTESTPEPPAVVVFDPLYDGQDDENMRFFTYAYTDFGITLTGLSEAGKREKTLTVPVGYDGRKVTVLGESLLSGGVAECLIVPEQSPLFRMENGVFYGASSLSHLVMLPTDPDAILPPISFEGVAADFVVHIQEGSEYDTQYYWRERGLTFVFDGASYQ